MSGATQCRHPGTVVCQQDRCGLSNTRTRSGDERYFAYQFHSTAFTISAHTQTLPECRESVEYAPMARLGRAAKQSLSRKKCLHELVERISTLNMRAMSAVSKHLQATLGGAFDLLGVGN